MAAPVWGLSFTVKARHGNKSPRSLLAPGVNWKNVRVLAVDDKVEICEQIQSILGQLGILCDVASDGYDACRVIEERGAYDIYFIDWSMPGMDGIELTRLIKSRTESKPSVVTMITALTSIIEEPNMAVVYNEQGDYPKALEWYLKSFRICYSRLGIENPNTKILISNMLSAYSKSGLNAPFEKWLVESVKIPCT